MFTTLELFRGTSLPTAHISSLIGLRFAPTPSTHHDCNVKGRVASVAASID